MALDTNVPLKTNQVLADLLAINANWEELPYTYNPVYSAADHSKTGSSNTVRYMIDTIGTTNKATILFRHNSGGEYTDYVFATDDVDDDPDYSSNTNITFKFENGARLDPDAGVTVILPSPENIDAGETQQIFTGDGDVTSATPGLWEAGWFGMVGDDTTQIATEFQKSLDTIDESSGGQLHISGGDYLVEAQITLPSYCEIILDHNATIKRDWSEVGFGGAVFINEDYLTGSYFIKIRGGKFELNDAAYQGFWFWLMQVDDLILDNIYTVSTQQSWNIAIAESNRVQVTDSTLLGGTDTEDGLHLIGCTGVRIDNCHIESGDDAFAITYEYDNYPDAETSGISVSSSENILVTNCTLKSETHDSIKIYIDSAITGSETISNVEIENSHCIYKEQLVVIDDAETDKLISDIRLTNITSEALSGQSGNGLKINYASNIDLTNVTVTGGDSAVACANLQQIDDCTFTNVKFIDNGSTTACVYLAVASNPIFTNCEIDGASGSIDGIDMSGVITNPKLMGCYIHDNNIGIDPGAGSTAGLIVSETTFENNTTNLDTLNIADNDFIFRDNIGFIGPNETRSIRIPLTDAAQNGWAFVWTNPYSETILLDRLIVDVTTASTAAATCDVGVAADETTHADDILDGISLQSTDTYDSLNVTDAGTNGRQGMIRMSANGGVVPSITGQVLSASGADLVGFAYIKVIGR